MGDTESHLAISCSQTRLPVVGLGCIQTTQADVKTKALSQHHFLSTLLPEHRCTMTGQLPVLHHACLVYCHVFSPTRDYIPLEL